MTLFSLLKFDQALIQRFSSKQVVSHIPTKRREADRREVWVWVGVVLYRQGAPEPALRPADQNEAQDGYLPVSATIGPPPVLTTLRKRKDRAYPWVAALPHYRHLLAIVVYSLSSIRVSCSLTA